MTTPTSPTGPESPDAPQSLPGPAKSPRAYMGRVPDGTQPVVLMPAAVRQRCLVSFAERIDVLEQTADGTLLREVMTKDGPIRCYPSHKDSVAAVAQLGRFAGLEKVTIEDVTPPRATLSGEERMGQVLGMMARVLALSGAAAQLSAGAKQLQAIQALEVMGQTEGAT